jgi:hypothetical protein
MGACRTPTQIVNKRPDLIPGKYQYVPCGDCIYCHHSRVNDWVFRLNQESKEHSLLSFATLTYEQAPATAIGLDTLDKRDIQLFFKRLRKNASKISQRNVKIKYFLVGEYGTITNRPHYHAIIFGATNNEVENAWKGYYNDDTAAINGHVYFGQVEGNSIAYCAKYFESRWQPINDLDDREKPSSLMSKNLGLNFITPQMVNYFHNTLTPTLKIDGHWQSLPRYYRDRIFNETQKNQIFIKSNALQYEKYLKQISAHGSVEAFAKIKDARTSADNYNIKLLKLKKRIKI